MSESYKKIDTFEDVRQRCLVKQEEFLQHKKFLDSNFTQSSSADNTSSSSTPDEDTTLLRIRLHLQYQQEPNFSN